MANSMINVLGITKRFGSLKVIKNISFTLNEGEVLGLIGPNGAGKTTLFNIISGSLKPDYGKIYIEDCS
jgi:ABC-type branched-subunit amino acid transport system ATPase component